MKGEFEMKYFINKQTGGLTCTTSESEAKRLSTVGFTEVSQEVYKAEYRKVWFSVVGDFSEDA